MSIRILVVTHKDYWMPNEKIYLPILVGNKKIEKEFLKDNVGNNISYKNKNYCELTAIYWAWKNLYLEKNDYIGLCHYRRYFSDYSKVDVFIKKDINSRKNLIMKEDRYKDILKDYDVIVGKNVLKRLTMKKQYIKGHSEQSLIVLRKVIENLYPDDIKIFDEIINKKILYPYNMFVMSKKYFDEYCEWLFNILFNFEKEMDISKYDNYQSRIFGFLSERLFTIWLLKKNLKIYESEIIFLEENPSLFERIRIFIKSKLYK